MSEQVLDKVVGQSPSEGTALASFFKAASTIVQALQECDPGLREDALELFAQLKNGGLPEEDVRATTALLAEILFPNADGDGIPGLDLDEAEKIAVVVDPATKPVLERMDREEAVFSARLRKIMDEKGMTQVQLAEKLGIGQPAVSMLLNRQCRPQRTTVRRCAEALGVPEGELWPLEQ